jgi:uncharacterized protein (DUF3084 family)
MNIDLTDYAIPIIALLGTIFGGAGLEFIKRWLGKAKEKDDTATNLRNELRTELTALKAEMAAVEKELDEWKAKYYDVVEKYLTVKIQYENLLRQLGDRQVQETKEITMPKKDIDTEKEPGV